MDLQLIETTEKHNLLLVEKSAKCDVTRVF